MAIPEPHRTDALAQVERFCSNHSPAHVLDELRIDHVVRGNTITIRECRAPWKPEYGPDWTTRPCAQLRYSPGTGTWTLYWPDRNQRWHLYPDAQPTADLDWLLREIDVDRQGAFWG